MEHYCELSNGNFLFHVPAWMFGSLYSEIFPTGIRNTAMNASFNLAHGVQFFNHVIIAVLGKNCGLSSGIFLGAIIAVFAGFWIWKFPETKGRDLRDLNDNETKQLKGIVS